MGCPRLKSILFTANLLTVYTIIYPGCSLPHLNVKYSGTVTCGDNYEAKIINVMLEVAVKRGPKQCFLEPVVWKSKWRVQRGGVGKKKKKVQFQFWNGWNVMNCATNCTHTDMHYYCFSVDTKWPLLHYIHIDKAHISA